MKRFFLISAVTVTGFAAQPLTAQTTAPAVYATPQDALEAMMAEMKPDGDMMAVFGSDAADVVSTGNPDRDAANEASMQALYSEGYRFAPVEAGVEILFGAEGWPFPIPLHRVSGGWAFDLETGRDEVYFRRIGINELNAIEVLAAYVDIQAEYRLVDHDGDGVMEFADHLLSSDGGRDGLFWAEPGSPMGERIALASLDGHNDGTEDREAEPFGGYYYRLLMRQGPDAPGGAMRYMVNGNMVAGHAMLAVPADYGHSGIHSFLVGENGVIYEADLGENTLDIAESFTNFNPGAGWSPVE